MALQKKKCFFFFILKCFVQSIGVPVEGKVRIQLNLKVQQAKHINSVKNFRDIVFPIVWVEEVSLITKQNRKKYHSSRPFIYCGFMAALLLVMNECFQVRNVSGV